MPKPLPPTLSREQGDDVLRYWLAALRLEEALQVRPQARRTPTGPAVPRLDQPTPGQDYFKLPLDAAVARLLSDQQQQVKRAFDPELSGFFETWLNGQYRRSEDEGDLSHLLSFPVVHLPKGELAGLVRCAVRLRFGTGESKAFRAPTRAERLRSNFPPVPDEARLTRVPQQDSAWPFFIDTRLLRQPLGVPGESIDALFEALRTQELVSEQQMLALLTTTLEAAVMNRALNAEQIKSCAESEACELEGWLGRLTLAVRRLLEQSSSRARVYAVGIVVDGTQAKTTWHLQRELNQLLDAEAGGRWKVDSALGAYLTGRAQVPGEAPQRALFPGPALTASQRAAAEHFWGSRLTAVQGPPGTGKTSLILHLCAEAVVRQVDQLLDRGRIRSEPFLIASSNNRAVDNVIEPLTAGDGLPLALRVGSRQVCEHQLQAQLRRTSNWLKRAEAEPLLERTERLARTSAHFRELREELDRVFAPRREALERIASRARLQSELSELPPIEPPSAIEELTAAQRIALLAALPALEKRLNALSKLCEVAPGHAPVRALERHYKRTTSHDLPAFVKALADAELTLELPLPPPVELSANHEQRMERWEEASELCLSRLAELRANLEGVAKRVESVRQRERVLGELAALGPDAELPLPEVGNHDQLSQELFTAAVAVREAWASQLASELGPAISTTLRTVEQERSLRPLFRNEPEAARQLCRLFGIWGSTLLSLGNCFASDTNGIARLVIDEAGQCHPAHAVSALMRAESALVIGDVNQLSPVIELGADDEARLLRGMRLDTPTPLLLPYRVHAEAEVSSQSIADRAVETRVELVDHFRCQREIIEISDQLCRYGLTVHTARADRTRHAAYLQHPVCLVDLRGEQARLAGSWCNELELAETLALVQRLLDGGVHADEIAVITPYRGQLERLRRSFVESRIPLEFSAELAESGGSGQRAGVALGTVHRFQGGERSIVLFSSVVTEQSSLGFLNTRPNLLNVAISRARHHFVCLGHAEVLALGPRTRLLTRGAHALSPAAYASSRPLFA